jgi:tryptophan synthase alpha chain
MNRVDIKFRQLKKQKRKAFIAYITAGDPNLNTTARLVPALEKAGVDMIELGIPFSDPLADGPTIQAASERALKVDTTLRKTFAVVARLRNKVSIPIVFMTYYNPVLRYGLGSFFDSCKSAGVDGVIIPDLPCEEAKELVRLGRKKGIATIFLAAPTSTAASIKAIAKNSSGFIYYVSLTGVTGARSRLASDIASNVRRIKAVTDKPVAVGFGISTSSQARQLAKTADGVIVGSAIVKIIGEKKNIILRVSKFARSLSKAIHNA